jgi:hypothetical protein
MTVANKRPVQIYLEERQTYALRRLADQENTSVSDLIRRSIDLLLSQLPPESDPAYHIIGLGYSGIADLGLRHDEYLAQDIEGERE